MGREIAHVPRLFHAPTPAWRKTSAPEREAQRIAPPGKAHPGGALPQVCRELLCPRVQGRTPWVSVDVSVTFDLRHPTATSMIAAPRKAKIGWLPHPFIGRAPGPDRGDEARCPLGRRHRSDTGKKLRRRGTISSNLNRRLRIRLSDRCVPGYDRRVRRAGPGVPRPRRTGPGVPSIRSPGAGGVTLPGDPVRPERPDGRGARG